ncbi:MAG: aminotransferase class I/II-fold pyridoxal phosphate-dependent enzyme [Nanoarchaeota archaeon]
MVVIHKHELAKIMKRLGGEKSFDMSLVVEKLEKKGNKIVKMHIGQSNFKTPEHIVEAGVKALYDGLTGYTPSPGTMECREAVANFIPKHRSVYGDIGPENVVITPGGKPVIFFGILSTIDKGDEVLYPNPGYPIYISAIDIAKGKGIPYAGVDDLKGKINKRTKMVIINSPHNPTGEIIGKKDLEEIAYLVVEEYDSLVMSDEVYSRILYPAGSKFESILQFPGMLERTIMLDCHSKTYAMPGWRFGYGVGAPKYINAISEWITNTSACVPGFVQKAGIAAMEGDQTCVDEMVKEFERRRDLTVKLFDGIDDIYCPEPGGAFYAFLDVGELCGKGKKFKNSTDMQEKILHEAFVSTLSGTHFGIKNGYEKTEPKEYIRLAYTVSQEEIKEGHRRISDYLFNSHYNSL